MIVPNIIFDIWSTKLATKLRCLQNFNHEGDLQILSQPNNGCLPAINTILYTMIHQLVILLLAESNEKLISTNITEKLMTDFWKL
jgi:hypothetical protein